MTDVKKSDANNVVVLPFSRPASKASPVSCELNAKKREVFAEWLQKGTVMLVFDARREDVKVPTAFRNKGDLRLNFDYNFQIADFNFNESAVWATLSFDSEEHFCMVPWACVFAIQSFALSQGAVWLEHFPKDLNPEEVLGMGAEMCEEGCSHDTETHEELDNVIAVDFSKN